ncbi:MAG: GWxTD domain-containing protein [Balneolaceae bacterium]
MYLQKHHCLWLLLLLFYPLSLSGQFHDADWFEQGLLAEFRGEYEQALNIWMNAREQLDQPDSRIGLGYIRVATEQEMDDHYETATDMYLWAISSPFTGVNRAAVRQEIERLRPLLGDGIYRQWLNWFEERNQNLASDMKGFWIQMDPTPGETVNERLIEHWHRIAYSRANFSRNSNTIYGTDDRALIHVRYGKPDIKRAGVLSLDNQNIGRWLSQQFNSARMPDDPEGNNPSFSFDDENLERENAFEQLEEYVFQFHEYPEYEIWVYHLLNNHQTDPLIFIFGTDIRTGDYQRQQSVDDFIPQRAYLSDRRSTTLKTDFIRQGLTPALVLQMLYYEQLVDISSFFEDRLNSIRESFIEQGPLAYSSLDLSLRSQSREMLEMRAAEAPVENSSISRLLPSIPVEVHQYRLLDDESNPVIISFVESNPTEALLRDMEIIRDGDSAAPEPDYRVQDPDYLGEYLLHHKLLVYDGNWEEIEYNRHSPAIRFTESPTGTVVQSVFLSPHRSQNFQAAAAELINSDPQSATPYTSIFPNQLRGLGTLKNQQPPPLTADPETLELGDLILGYRDDLPEDYPFAFRVANDQMIAGDESLLLHFEVYNLQPRPSTGFTRFQLTYRIYPVLEDGTLLTDQEAFYLTINFEDDQTRVIEDLEIQTAKLSSGLYELQVYIEDMVSSQEKNRNIRFEVTN